VLVRRWTSVFPNCATIFRRPRSWNWSNIFSCLLYNIDVSQPYNKDVKITALLTVSFVSFEMPRLFHTRFPSLPMKTSSVVSWFDTCLSLPHVEVSQL
jgi:hypothetical protein